MLLPSIKNHFFGDVYKATLDQWPFQEPKLEVATIYKAYVREYPQKIWPYMVQYLHFKILKFPLIRCAFQWFLDGFLTLLSGRYTARLEYSSVTLC